jgi:hypothetical protein
MEKGIRTSDLYFMRQVNVVLILNWNLSIINDLSKCKYGNVNM